MAIRMKKIPYIAVGIPHWSGPREDSLDLKLEDMRIEFTPGNRNHVKLIHEGARPTNPFFAMLSASDIIELADLIQKGEIE